MPAPDDTAAQYAVLDRPDIAPLLTAGATLAAVAEPHKDLPAFGCEFRELAATLKFLGDGLEYAEERAEQTYDGRFSALMDHKLWNLAEQREWTREEIDRDRRRELQQARDTAIRSAKRALVDLARVVAEMERQP